MDKLNINLSENKDSEKFYTKILMAMNLKQLSLHQTLFYLSILKFGITEISNANLKSISISIYGTIIDNLTEEIIISYLEERLNYLLEGHLYRDGFTFSFTPEEFKNINPKYYGRKISYSLQRKGDQIFLTEVNY